MKRSSKINRGRRKEKDYSKVSNKGTRVKRTRSNAKGKPTKSVNKMGRSFRRERDDVEDKSKAIFRESKCRRYAEAQLSES